MDTSKDTIIIDDAPDKAQAHPPPSTYDPAKVLAIGAVSTPRLDEIARSFAERCASTKELPRPEQVRQLLNITRVANVNKLLPRFERMFWGEMSRRTGISVAELRAKADSIPPQEQPTQTPTAESEVSP